jgi:hypothetical protein
MFFLTGSKSFDENQLTFRVQRKLGISESNFIYEVSISNATGRMLYYNYGVDNGGLDLRLERSGDWELEYGSTFGGGPNFLRSGQVRQARILIPTNCCRFQIGFQYTPLSRIGRTGVLLYNVSPSLFDRASRLLLEPEIQKLSRTIWSPIISSGPEGESTSGDYSRGGAERRGKCMRAAPVLPDWGT